MCRVFSCIIDRAGRVYPQKDDPSHTVIAKEHGLKEDGISELNRAKIEVTPIERMGHHYGKPPSFDTWEVEVDEASIPEWVNDRHYRSAMEAAHKWWKTRVITEDKHVDTGMWLVLEGSPIVHVSGCASVTLLHIYGTSSPDVYLRGEAAVDIFENSFPWITTHGPGSFVRSTGKSKPKVLLHHGAIMYAGEHSAPYVTAYPGSMVRVETCGRAIIRAHKEAGVHVYRSSATVVEYLS